MQVMMLSAIKIALFPQSIWGSLTAFEIPGRE